VGSSASPSHPQGARLSREGFLRCESAGVPKGREHSSSVPEAGAEVNPGFSLPPFTWPHSPGTPQAPKSCPLYSDPHPQEVEAREENRD
jgi:hypothetical protein